DGNIQTGTLEVNKKIKEQTKQVFEKLFNIKFPLHNVTAYNGRTDVEIIQDNDTTSFNFRYVAGTEKLSKHAFGLAIDINPKNNPAKPSRISHVYDESIEIGKIDQTVIDIFKS